MGRFKQNSQEYETRRINRVYGTVHIGQLLQKRRRELGLTQEYVSNALKISQRLVGDIERGKEGVSIGKVLHYANYLGVDFVMVVREKDV